MSDYTDGLALVNELNSVIEKLSVSGTQALRYGKEYVQAKNDYYVAKALEVERLHSEGMPATLIPQVVKGHVAKEMFAMDTADVMYTTAKESINVLKLKLKVIEAQIERDWNSR